MESMMGMRGSWCTNDLDLVEYPALKYGDTNVGGQWLRTYEMNRTFPIMYNFTNRTLQPPYCTPENLGACTSIQKMEMIIRQIVFKWVKIRVSLSIPVHQKATVEAR
jgi:hypothetical protein